MPYCIFSTVKRAYHQESLRVHPDRNTSVDATEKFKTVCDVYRILSDVRSKTRYDINGVVEVILENTPKLPTDFSELEALKNNYIGSNKERQAIYEAYIKCSGNFERMMARVPLLSLEDKSRVRSIISSELCIPTPQ